MSTKLNTSLFNKKILFQATKDSVIKLNPVLLIKNPVIFIVATGSVLTTIVVFAGIFQGNFSTFNLQIAIWLWFTVLFANFSEAIAEGRGKAQAESLRKNRTQTIARKIVGKQEVSVIATELKKGDNVICKAGEVIPSDGEVIEGIASVDESAITGESAPVIRESGGDRSAVTGGTKVISDWILIRIIAEPGDTFIDRMIALVEGAKRHKTPNEIALSILLSGLSIIFLVVVVTLPAFFGYSLKA
ncbi:MAG: potassium-transporting ATPase subunit B, partial [Bacteroidetes bacterium]|nr:potassium-transporting ATPase subunit B [Bacteroidota bacterium]